MCSSFKALNNFFLTKPLYNASLFCRHTPSSRFIAIISTFQRFFSSSHSVSFMEVVKAVYKQGSAAPDTVAIRADQKSYSYRDLVLSVQKIYSLLCSVDLKTTDEGRKHEYASELVNGVSGHGHLGGARIGIVAKPSAEFVAAVLGTWLSGGVAVPLALSYPEVELLHVMNDSDISMILSTEDYRQAMQNLAVKTSAQFSLLQPVPSLNSSPSVLDLSRIEAIYADRVKDPALIVYTSGTTGKPKGVVHTHKSISAQVQTLAEAWEYSATDQFLHCLPLHHVHGLFNALLAPLYAGSTVEFMPRFSVRGIWQRWRESYSENGTKAHDNITVFTGVPTMYTRLIQGYEAMDPELQAVSASAARQLRLMMCGSSALPQPVMQQWETITGHRLLERYGMTEFVMAIANPLRGERKAGTVGKPFPGVQVRIAEDENGSDTLGGGELCIKSPSLFKEYWKLPKVTKESFTDDGFFKTGDAGKINEDGYYIILGRTSADIMKVGGYKLSALEIESVLLEHPIVAECSVLGLPDKDYGDAVCAIIVPEEEAKKKQEEESKPILSLEELCTWAKDKLAPYKLPTRLFLWDSLPRNAMGKVNKKELKKVLAAEE
ncbi:AMP-binding domain-containing protein [Cephalotus follicularis]|uniref:AMP-binding domain-containing protein n=1 Tax=Cephalotus follicularis TaxID=3775 RepID=A0A1Q3B980_CEPFO|nr:AMP-binding domain-containing protein [Cephalotus follicularis]